MISFKNVSLISLFISSLNSCQLPNERLECNQVKNLLNELMKSKVEYERSVHFKKDESKNKLAYFTNVKTFKNQQFLAEYRGCIEQLIVEDSLNPMKKIIQFQYQPEEESLIRENTLLKYSEFLKVMLINLEIKNNDSTIVYRVNL